MLFAYIKEIKSSRYKSTLISSLSYFEEYDISFRTINNAEAV